MRIRYFWYGITIHSLWDYAITTMGLSSLFWYYLPLLQITQPRLWDDFLCYGITYLVYQITYIYYNNTYLWYMTTLVPLLNYATSDMRSPTSALRLLTYAIRLHYIWNGITCLCYETTYLCYEATYLCYEITYFSFGITYLWYAMSYLCYETISAMRLRYLWYKIMLSIIVKNETEHDIVTAYSATYKRATWKLWGKTTRNS